MEKKENRIKTARKSSGLTQVEMSNKYGIPLDTIKSWDSGRSRPQEWVENLLVEKMEETKMEENRIPNGTLIVDCAYEAPEYPGNIMIEVNGEYYLLPVPFRSTNDLKAFKKLDKNIIANKCLKEISSYRYPTNQIEKKDGFDLGIGRAITDEEFTALKKELNLTEDEISDSYTETLSAIFGKKTEKTITCRQIKIPCEKGIPIESALKKKGIHAANITAGIVQIRISD